MGQSILTSSQHHFLQLAQDEEGLNRQFFLTGGTALAEFYLKHRLSEDLDFFSFHEFSESQVDRFVVQAAKDAGATYTKEKQWGMFVYHLTYPGGEELKVDFNHRPFKELETGKKFGSLKVASLWDITVDKLYTIFNRLRARDFVDFYFGWRKAGCDIGQLVAALEEKYETGLDRLTLISRFPSVKDVADYPKMIVPFEREEMESFFLGLAKEMEREIFK